MVISIECHNFKVNLIHFSMIPQMHELDALDGTPKMHILINKYSVINVFLSGLRQGHQWILSADLPG